MILIKYLSYRMQM